MNKIFKCRHLPRQKISHCQSHYNNCGRIFVWSTLKTSIPRFKQTALNRTYNPIVPEYLHGRPKPTIPIVFIVKRLVTNALPMM